MWACKVAELAPLNRAISGSDEVTAKGANEATDIASKSYSVHTAFGYLVVQLKIAVCQVAHECIGDRLSETRLAENR
jgi:hypothetical protein